MNIAYLHRTRGQGVEGVHIYEIIRQFRDLGHDVSIVSPAAGNTSELDKPGSSKKSIGTKLPEFVFELMEIGYNLIGFIKLKNVAKIKQPDLIYERYSIFNIFGVFFGKKYGVKTVIEANYTSRLPLVRKRSSLLKPLARMFDNYIFKGANRIIAVSSYIKQHLIDEFHVSEEKIIILPNAADPEKFRYVDLSQNIDKKVVGFVGGFYPWHGLEFLVTVFDKLVKEIPDVELVLVGDGPEKPRIIELVESFGISDSVKFTGKVNHNELSSYISSFYVGVMPDSNMYGSPMKIFEYMSMGVPVIAPDYPPICDAMENETHGLIFKKKDAADMLRCFRRILVSPELRKKLSLEARQRIMLERNWKNNALESIANL